MESYEHYSACLSANLAHPAQYIGAAQIRCYYFNH